MGSVLGVNNSFALCTVERIVTGFFLDFVLGPLHLRHNIGPFLRKTDSSGFSLAFSQ